MVSIENKIRSILNTMDAVLPLISGDWYRANVEIEKVTLPAVIFIHLDGEFKIGPTKIQDQPNCLIAFMNKIDVDHNESDREDIAAGMKELAVEFLASLNASGFFNRITSAPYTISLDKLNVNIAGVVLELTLVEKTGTNTGCI